VGEGRGGGKLAGGRGGKRATASNSFFWKGGLLVGTARNPCISAFGGEFYHREEEDSKGKEGATLSKRGRALARRREGEETLFTQHILSRCPVDRKSQERNANPFPLKKGQTLGRDLKASKILSH